eukprot:6174014-Pleurochrysis_carterae.AAC.1
MQPAAAAGATESAALQSARACTSVSRDGRLGATVHPEQALRRHPACAHTTRAREHRREAPVTQPSRCL